MESVLTGVVLRKTPLNVNERGTNPSWRATVRTIEGDLSVFIKRPTSHSDREIMVEIACALLGRAINLPIPRPLLIQDRELDMLLFGCELLPHPDLTQYLLNNQLADDWLVDWLELPKASAFDEWIGNEDRNSDNLLTDGVDFWLIDHGLALYQLLKSDENTDNNYLLEIAKSSADNDKKRWQLVKEFNNLIKLFPTNVEEQIKIVAPYIDESILKLLQDRTPHLFTLLRRAVLNHEELF
jgi:hypothetical protein